MSEDEWDTLCAHIAEGDCTPVLGAGACDGVLPLGSKVARDWSAEFGYPLANTEDLAMVAQYIAIRQSSLVVKSRMAGIVKRPESPPDHAAEPHRVLASLPIPLYLTTNYDAFMVRALRDAGKEPVRELCRWNDYLKTLPVAAERLQPSVVRPLVYHLHGNSEEAKSLVLTEDDYLEFLVNLSRDTDMIPLVIQAKVATSMMLFLGYSLHDWTFRVLFRWLQNHLGRSVAPRHVSVQLTPGEGDGEAIQGYLEKYFANMRISVYWGTCHDFVRELGVRWKASQAS